MYTRRAPLARNLNVANSPLRAPSALASHAKQKRSYATVQREEAYGQPPPVKKQALENGSQKPIRSPAKVPGLRTHVFLQCASATTTRSTVGINKDHPSRAVAPSATRTNNALENEKEAWKKHYRAKFPKMVFYFESIPDDIRAKLNKRVTFFGARQEPFFSIDVTHVITTRPIPPERAGPATEGAAAAPASTEMDQQPKPRAQPVDEQPQTINPSLLDRNTAARRKLLFDLRQPPIHSQQPNDVAKRTGNGSIKSRNNDVLEKAREMGKKIWSLEKFQNMLAVLLESEHPGSQVSRAISTRSQYGASKNTNQPNLLQLLRNERINGPSDRDPTAIKDLVYFKGAYIYVSDMDEKLRPIMIRDYPKVANKADGEWPQFRSVGNGRCPFVEETEALLEKDARKNRARDKARALVAAAAAAVKREDGSVSTSKAQGAIASAKLITGKRSLEEMEESGRNVAALSLVTPAAKTELLSPAKTTLSRGGETRAEQNTFISRTTSGRRLLAGEPVASGMQPSNMTSAIRSQMISSTSGINGAKARTSKEVHGLQRKVLQKATTLAPHEPSSRRLAEVSMEVASSRSTNIGRQTSRTLRAQDDDFYSQRTAIDNTVLVVKQITTPINEEASKVVAKEVAILSSLRHRHIVRYFDNFLDSEGRLAIVMEWARGGSLEQLLKRRSNTYNSMGPVTPSAKIDKRYGMGPFTQTTLFSETRNSMGPFTQSDQNKDNLNNNDMEFDSTCTQDKQFSNTCNSTEPITHGIEVSLCDGMGPFSQDTVLTMLVQLCDALAYLHGRHIVHRDLCARNVLLCGPSESSLYLKLCDFGVSKMLQESVSGDEGQLKGSVECLSPEQCMGLPATTSCDIWALGCLLYRIITLHHPFPTQSVAALSRELSRYGERLDLCATRLPHCDPLVRLMLSRDPHLRPTASDLLRSPQLLPYTYTIYANLYVVDVDVSMSQ